MYSPAEEIRRGKAARKRREGMKYFGKWMLGIFIAILVVVVFGVTAVVVSHNVNTKSEISALKEAGLYRLVTVETDRKMNVASYGNLESNEIFVPISGLGVQNFSVFMQHILEPVKEKVGAVFIDRAGCGYSDDSTHKQTVEQIVDDYRKALEKSGVEGPYILVAHEFGGVYASYWASQYPEDIKGIVYLDATDLEMAESLVDLQPSNEDKVRSMLFKFGFQRIFYNDYYPYVAKSLTKQESVCSRALNVHSVLTQAHLSELSLAKTNYEYVFENYEANNVPKLYVSASNGFSTNKDVIKYFEYLNVQREELGLPQYYDFEQEEEMINKDIEEFLAASDERFANTEEFATLLGNCIVTKMPGHVAIYEQKTEGIKDLLMDYVAVLNNVKDAKMRDYYDDFKAVNWENYQEEHENNMAESTAPTEEATEPAED